MKVSEIEEQIKQLVAKGIVQAKQIIQKIRERLFPAYEDEGMIILLQCRMFLLILFVPETDNWFITR